MISNDRRIRILVELRELTERQLSAARELNGTAMRELNELRSDHLFNLQVAMQAPMPNDQELKQALIDEVKRLHHKNGASFEQTVVSLKEIDHFYKSYQPLNQNQC